MWVNAEKYVFAPEILDSGTKLLNSFSKTQHLLRNIYSKICQENINFSSEQIKFEVSKILEEFDFDWSEFEKVLKNL